MKILLATPVYPPEIGTVPTYVEKLSKHLASRHALTTVAYTSMRNAVEGKLYGISKRWPLVIRLFLFFITIIRNRHNTDILYAVNAMAAGLPGALACKLTQIPLVIRYLGDESEARKAQKYTKRIMGAIQGFVLTQARAVAVVSEQKRELLIARYRLDPRRVFVVYHVADDLPYIPFETTKDATQLFISANKIPAKEFAWITSALEIVAHTIPGVHFVPINPESISGIEKAYLRIQSGLAIVPNEQELPQSVLDGYMAKLPIVTIDTEAVREYVDDNETGLLVERGNVQALAEACGRILLDENFKEKLIRGGEEKLADSFSWVTHIARLETILESVLLKPTNKV